MCVQGRDILCSAPTAISGDAAVGGVQGYPICIDSNFQTCRRVDLGTEPTPRHMWSYVANEPKHNVWLKIVFTGEQSLRMVAERVAAARSC